MVFQGNIGAFRTPEYEVRQIVQNRGLNLVDDKRDIEPGEMAIADGILFTDTGFKQAPALRYIPNDVTPVLGPSGNTTSSPGRRLGMFMETSGVMYDVFHYNSANNTYPDETWIRSISTGSATHILKCATSPTMTGATKVRWCESKTAGTLFSQTPNTSLSGGTETSLACGTVYKTGGVAISAGEMSGKVLKILSGDDAGKQFMITTNTTSMIYIDGRFNSAVPAGVTFEICYPLPAIVVLVQGNRPIVISNGSAAEAAEFSAFSGSAFTDVASYSNRVFISTISGFVYFSSPGLASFPPLNNIFIKESGQSCLIASPSRLVIFSNSGRWYLNGDSPENFALSYGGPETTTSRNKTCAFCTPGDTVFFVSDRGLENCSVLDSVSLGDQSPISNKLFRPGSNSLFGDGYNTVSNLKDLRITYWNNRLYLLVANVNAVSGDSTVIYVLDLGKTQQFSKASWSRFSLQLYVTYAGIDASTGRALFCAGDTAFYVDESRTDSSDGTISTSTQVSVSTGILNFGDVGRPQNVYKARWRCRVKGTFTISLSSLDYSGNQISSASISVAESELTEKYVELFVNKRTYGLAFKLEKTSSSTNDFFESYMLETFTQSQPKPK